MRAFLGLAAIGLFLATASANGASLCNCCVSDNSENCAAACSVVKSVPGQCSVVASFAGKKTISTEGNSLYGISLRNLSLVDTTRPQLEDLRKLLENLRRELEKDRKAMMRDYRKHKINEAAFKASTQLYEDAIVNYYSGLRAYRDRLAAVPKQAN